MTNSMFFQCELLSREYVDLFAKYLLDRANAIMTQQSARKKRQMLTVTEIGAGTGRFAHFVRKRLLELDPADRVRLIASDIKGSTGDATSE